MFETILLILAICAGFYIQTILGFGAAILALPILLLTLGLQDAVSFISVFFFLYSLYQMYKVRKAADMTTVYTLILGVIIGLIMGIQVLKIGHPVVLKKYLGAFIILYVVSRMAKIKKQKWMDKFGLLFGIGSGFFSGLFSVGGPFCVIYVHNKDFKIDVLRSTIILTLGITDLIKLPMLFASNLVNLQILKSAAIVFPFFVASIYLGNRSYAFIKEDLFHKIIMILLLISGISLLF
ncbi:MAG: sulfite exporter TauE/SafE family protein [Flavobacteriales bacterium]|nr:sulfite exporter TauE/SafE family protein [Flavobacteriales bacterium]